MKPNISFSGNMIRLEQVMDEYSCQNKRRCRNEFNRFGITKFNGMTLNAGLVEVTVRRS